MLLVYFLKIIAFSAFWVNAFCGFSVKNRTYLFGICFSIHAALEEGGPLRRAYAGDCPSAPPCRSRTGISSIEYYTCSVCGKLFSDAEATKEITKTDTVIPATGSTKCDGGEDCPSIQLKDVDRSATSWYHEAVDWGYVNDVVKGISETSFSPNSDCTRAQAVTFLWRASGCPDPKTSKSPFTDVKSGTYYYDAVLWACENEITNL